MSFAFSTIFSVLFFLTGSPVAGSEKTHDSSYVKFITGIYLINSTNNLTDQQKAQRYSELVEVCGINNDSAQSFASRYYNKPDEWKKIHEKIQTLLSEYENNRKNDTIISKINNNPEIKEPGRSK